jgi:hypothetical protein
VIPFLNSLEHTAFFPIQQVAIIGDADYIMCIRGRFVWLELKKLRGQESALQKHKADWVGKCGGFAILADPDNWELVKEFLNQLDGGILDTDSLQRLGHGGTSTELAETKAKPHEDASGVQREAHRKVGRGGA